MSSSVVSALLSPVFGRSADAFFTSLSAGDVRRLRLAKRIFLANTGLNAALYYTGFSPDGYKVKFPATISWTVRRGLPQKSNLLFWSSGWYLVGSVFARRGDRLARLFAAQMYCVGVVTLGICPVGASALQDQVHFIAAGLYFVYHCVLFEYVRTSRPYQAGFYASFAVFLAAVVKIRKLEARYCFRAEADEEGRTKYAASRAKLAPELRRQLWRFELVQMLSENAMFVSFLLGVTSGLPRVTALKGRCNINCT